MDAVNVLAPDVGMARACAALRVHRTGVYRVDWDLKLGVVETRGHFYPQDFRQRHASQAPYVDTSLIEHTLPSAPPTVWRVLPRKWVTPT